MRIDMKKYTEKWILLLLAVLLVACTDDNDYSADDGSSQPTAIDAGPSYTEKTVDVSRDGKAQGQVVLRFYSDKPHVAYMSVTDFHKMMTLDQTMTIKRQGDAYQLTTKGGTALVYVKADYLHSTTYLNFVSLMDLVGSDLPGNASYDGSKYLKFVNVETESTFKNTDVTFNFRKYDIDLHDDGTNVYIPFATLADMYANDVLTIVAYNGEKILVSTKQSVYAMNTTDPEFTAKPYRQTAVEPDMAQYRYNELCFVFDNFFGMPGRTKMEKAGLAEKGFDATLEAMDKGKMVKQLLQSTDNTDFTWGMMALQNLLFDGGHTNVTTFPSAPNVVKEEFEKKMLAASAKYPEAEMLYIEWRDQQKTARQKVYKQLKSLRDKAYGDVVYVTNSQKTLGVIILDSFAEMDDETWKKYYASQKTDTDFQELLTHYKKDDFIRFLYALQQAKNDGVKNIIVDVSQNPGGSTDIVVATASILRKNRTGQLWSQNVLEGKNQINTLLVDTNFDGIFDEKDNTHPKYDCSNMNIAVLTSLASFSCGNVFAAVMKDYGFTTMGERSGGGPNSVQVRLTPDGFQYVISGAFDRSSDKNFVNIDPGVAPSDGYAFEYTQFYNLDFLTQKMH